MTHITPCGLDFGNGFVKLSIGGQTSKIPAAYAISQPQGQVSATTGKELKAKAFSMTPANAHALWFGPDVLGGPLIREIDTNKYNAAHVRIMFAAALANHAKVHKIDPAQWGKLAIAASMPPSAYQDAPTRARAEKAYKSAFSTRQAPWYIRSDIVDTFRISTQFETVYSEAANISQIMKISGMALVADIGYGTLDLVSIVAGEAAPRFAKSFNVGLVHGYETIDSIDPNRAELEILRSKAARHGLASHFNAIKNKITLALRHMNQGGNVDLILAGGGTRLMAGDVLNGFKGLAPKVSMLDEYANAKANEAMARGIV